MSDAADADGARPSPPAEGVRVAYDDLPARIRAWVDQQLASPVVSALTQPGGFSPGAAARLRTADGRRAFVKAVGAEANPVSPEMHRREAVVTAALPDEAPVPRLIATYDDGTWVALLLEDVAGRHPTLPWQPRELDLVLAATDRLARSLTPCPLPAAVDVADAVGAEFGQWAAAAADPPPALDPWVAGHLDRLAELEAGWPAAVHGETLLHLDLRADNMLIDPDERVWFVDWPWAARGHPVFDVVGLAPSVAMQGGPGPAETLARTRVGRAADRDAVTAMVAALAGFFCVQALAPPPQGLPTVRAFQAAQGEVALRWLRDLTGW